MSHTPAESEAAKLHAVEINADINELTDALKDNPEFEMLTAPIRWVYRKHRSDGKWLMFPEGDEPEPDDPDYFPRTK